MTIGVLYPGYAAEDDYPRAARLISPPMRFEVVHTTVGRDTHDIDALIDTGAAWRLAEGAERLAPVAPAAVTWACTSGSFVFGLEGARSQARALEEQLGVPASSTSLAFVAALHAAGIRKVSIGATYPTELTDRFRAFLEDADVRVVHVGVLGIMVASEGGRLTADEARGLALANDHPDAGAVLLPDTALHTIAGLGDLARSVGKPVLTANQVTAWDALRLAGHPAAVVDPTTFLLRP